LAIGAAFARVSDPGGRAFDPEFPDIFPVSREFFFDIPHIRADSLKLAGKKCKYPLAGRYSPI
jgi:hypothetical protein